MRRERLTILSAVATLLSFLAAGTVLPPLAAAPDTITVSGKVLAYDGATPAKGASVTLTRKATGQAFKSAPASDQGDYSVAGVPDGEYTISVQTAEGVFDLPNSVVIKSGQPSAVTVILPESAAVPAQNMGTAGKGLARSKAWLAIPIAGGVLLGAIILSNNNNDEDASPSKP